MKVYVFGNVDHEEDSVAIELARRCEVEGVEWVFVEPNGEVPFVGEAEVVILDVVQGLPGVRLIEGESLDRLILGPRGSVHDYDLGFQIKYLQKLGKLGEVKVIGIPWGARADEVVEEVGLVIERLQA